MPSTNVTTIQARDAKIISGIQKRLANVPSVVLAGVAYTPTALMALFKSQVDAANAVDTAKGQWKNAIQAYRTLTLTASNAVTGLREFVRQMFNNAPDAMADFGFTPKATAPRNPLAKVVAAVKNRATRVARGTLGSKKKLSITIGTSASDVTASVTALLKPGEPAAIGLTPPAASAPAPEPSPVTLAPATEHAGNGAPAAGPSAPHA